MRFKPLYLLFGALDTILCLNGVRIDYTRPQRHLKRFQNLTGWTLCIFAGPGKLSNLGTDSKIHRKFCFFISAYSIYYL